MVATLSLLRLPMPDPSTTRLSLVRSLRFCAGHRLLGHEGRCAFLHGHNYRVEVEVEALGGGTEVDEVGRVVDFALIKRRLLGWLDAQWDHTFILWEQDVTALAAVKMAEPTHENVQREDTGNPEPAHENVQRDGMGLPRACTPEPWVLHWCRDPKESPTLRAASDFPGPCESPR